MRRLRCLLGALLCLCPALAWAADGDLVDAQAGPAPGTWTQSWKLLDAAAVVDPGQWIYYGGFTTGSVEVTGLSGDTVTLNCTNAAGLKPANATAGTVLSTVTSNGYTSVTQPCRWIKAAVTIHGTGTVSALLTASASGGGGGGGGGGGSVTQGTSPWVENVTQFGGSVIVTGTGAGGAGIPRVTVSNDSNILATQSGTWTSRIVGNAGGVMDAAGQNAASPASELLVGAQFNTTPTTIASGNISPLQLDSAGNLLVNIKVGGAGTSMADAGTFTQASTSFTPVGCEFNSSVTNLSSGQAGAFSCTAARSLHVTMDNGSAVVTQARGLTAGDANVAEVAAWLYGMTPSGIGVALAATSGGVLQVAESSLPVSAGFPAALQKGVLIEGAVNQTPPFYPNGQVAPLALTSQGAAQVAIVSGPATAVESGSLTLGVPNVSEAIAVHYGQVVTDPSTMTLGTAGTGMRATFGAAGEAVVALNAVKGNLTKGTGNATGTGNTSVVAALGAGLSFCLTDIALDNTSASFTDVNLVDDVGGANTVIWGPLPAPATSGYTHMFGSPLCFSANKAAGFAAVTGVTTLRVSFLGYKTKE